MKLLTVALLLLTISLHATVGDIICLPGKSPGAQVVHVGSNHAFGYKTQHGETYGRHTRCAVVFKKSSSCPSLVVSCPKFDIAHPNTNCKGKGGDFLAIGKKRFCQNKGPTNFTSTAYKLTVSFNSHKKVEGKGAECTIACSDLEPTSSGTGCPESGSGSGLPLPPTRGNRTEWHWVQSDTGSRHDNGQNCRCNVWFHHVQFQCDLHGPVSTMSSLGDGLVFCYLGKLESFVVPEKGP